MWQLEHKIWYYLFEMLLHLFIWNVAVAISYTTGLAFGSPSLNVLDISGSIQYFDHDKANSISELITDKLRDFKKCSNI